jgi:hypothetical protein
MSLSNINNISAGDVFYLHMASVNCKYSEIQVTESFAFWVGAFHGYKSAFKIHLIAAQDLLSYNQMAVLLIKEYLKEIDK